MGLDDRTYAREGFNSDRSGWGNGSSSGSVADWPVWKKIIAANVVVFLLQIFVSRPATIEDFGPPLEYIQQVAPGELSLSEEEFRDLANEQLAYAPRISVIQEWFELDTSKVLQGQVWRVVTAGFCHDRNGIWHLLFNMLFLYWFGKRLESRYGSAEFCCFYFASLLVSSFAYMALDFYSGVMVPAIGASGAVWGIVALYATLYPYDRIYVYFLFPVQIRFLALIYFAFDLHPVLLTLSGQPQWSGVGHAAHIGGAVFGFGYWYFGWRLSPWLDRWRGKRKIGQWANSKTARPTGHSDLAKDGIYQFPTVEKERRIDAAREAKMDALLDKISSQGREALTDQELDFLMDASKQLRRE
jgi:membrane associated rhomboid family serine protease